MIAGPLPPLPQWDHGVTPSASPVLNGKVAVVSGAARGIGAATAIELARAGAHVLVNDIQSPDETLARIAASGGSAEAAVADVADLDAVEALFADALERLGRVDIVVTNVAYSDRELFYAADLNGIRRTIDVCMWGPFHFVRDGARAMIERRSGGAIVCISSPHAHRAIPGAMAYNMAKAAVDQMARTAACELAEHRIRVNIVHPGWTDTPGERKFFRDEELSEKGGQLPWGRLAHVDEIARGVLFLCDPASDYINGATLSIDGGALLPHEQMFRVKDRPSR